VSSNQRNQINRTIDESRLSANNPIASGTGPGGDIMSESGARSSRYAGATFPGLFEVEEPIVLAWSTLDSPGLVAQAENLDKGLCGAGHCPRTALLAGRDSPASVFGLDATDKALAGQMRELVDEIEARGLP
jgi:hypothetical protein